MINNFVLESKFFDFVETMVNLKSWLIVIFVLNSHISCQTITGERKRKLPVT